MVTKYNIDIETGQELEIRTLYCDGRDLILKTWYETNIFLLFERMKNNYKEVVKYLNIYNEPTDEDEPIVVDFNNIKLNKDFSNIINEMTERIEDCSYYQDNLVENSLSGGFGSFVMGELSKLDSHIDTIIEIDKKIKDEYSADDDMERKLEEMPDEEKHILFSKMQEISDKSLDEMSEDELLKTMRRADEILFSADEEEAEEEKSDDELLKLLKNLTYKDFESLGLVNEELLEVRIRFNEMEVVAELEKGDCVNISRIDWLDDDISDDEEERMLAIFENNNIFYEYMTYEDFEEYFPEEEEEDSF